MTLERVESETAANARQWESRPVLRAIYGAFQRRIAGFLEHHRRAIEIGAGIGSMRDVMRDVILTDAVVHPWLDLACSAYRLPIRDGAVDAVILFDVLHHLRRPVAALHECARVVGHGGRIVVFEPYISASTFPVYGLLHPEPVRLVSAIDLDPAPPADDEYYAAQGNATRMFFGALRKQTLEALSLKLVHAEAFAAWHYLLSGGFSRPQLYPAAALPLLRGIDRMLSAAPRLFGARCLVVLEKSA